MPRIDKVRLDNYYNRYQNTVSPTKRTGEVETPFGIDPDEKGVIYEPSHVPGKNRVPETERLPQAAAADESTAPAQEAAEAKKDETPQAAPRVTEWLYGIGSRLVAFLRGVWDKVWNGPEQPSPPAQEEAKPPQEGASAEEYRADETFAAAKTAETLPAVSGSDFLQEIIATHDLDQLVRYVTDDGQRKPARSTDLLTIYNRYGRVNRIDPSDRKKILEGNFHDIKL